MANSKVENLGDISGREFLVLAILAAAVLWMGVYPFPLTEMMHVTVTDLLTHVTRGKL